MIRLALAEEVARQLHERFLKPGTKEDGAFCLVREGKGRGGTRLLASEVLWPPANAWERQEVDMLRPSAQWISAAVSMAVQARAGLMFVHSHPNPAFPPGLSCVDQSSFRSLAETLNPTVDGPFAALVVHPQAWAGVVWREGHTEPINRIVGVGRTLSFLSDLPSVESSSAS